MPFMALSVHKMSFASERIIFLFVVTFNVYYLFVWAARVQPEAEACQIIHF